MNTVELFFFFLNVSLKIAQNVSIEGHVYVVVAVFGHSALFNFLKIITSNSRPNSKGNWGQSDPEC